MKSPLKGLKNMVIAHRGGHYADLLGEQTTAHFERAVALGVDFIEVDIRETVDQKLVCIHDAEYAGLVVDSAKYADIVAAASEKGLARPALLGELLEIARGKVGLDLELKWGGFEERLVAEVGDFEPVIYKCFDDRVVKRMKEVAPECTVGLLLGVRKPKLGVLGRIPELFPGRRVRKCKADFVSPHFQLVRFGFNSRMEKLGLPVLVWTVNDAPTATWVLSTACGVITDQPELCLGLRKR